MRISKTLSIIILLTFIEVTFTLWSAFQLSKGANFHRLNLLHQIHNDQLKDEILEVKESGRLDISKLQNIVQNIEKQSSDCLEEVGFTDKMLMKFIGTNRVLELCVADSLVSNKTLSSLEDYKKNKVDRDGLLIILSSSSVVFNQNSIDFEEPVTKTVDFIFKTLIPLVVFISFFNIIVITYLSRGITKSVKNVLNLITNKNLSKTEEEKELSQKRPRELQELFEVFQERDAELEKVNKSLANSNEELTQFAYRTSHDLRAPLVTTRRLARAIIEDVDDKEYDEIKTNSLKMEKLTIKLENLVADILDLAKADLLDTEKEKVNVVAVLNSIMKKLDGIYIDSNVVVENDVTPSTEILGSRVRVTQVLENLISNGIKYSDPDKKRRYVKVTSRETEEAIILNVEDNGLGIPSEFHGRVFGMFERFHQRVVVGSGLGLNIVKKHIDKIGAKIEFNSSKEGTEFQIIFFK